MYYSGGFFDEDGKMLIDFNGQFIPYKWKIFIIAELWSWFLEAVLIWYILRRNEFSKLMKAVFLIWCLSRGFDLVQFYIPMQINQFIIGIKILFNISILFAVIIHFDSDDI